MSWSVCYIFFVALVGSSLAGPAVHHAGHRFPTGFGFKGFIGGGVGGYGSYGQTDGGSSSSTTAAAASSTDASSTAESSTVSGGAGDTTQNLTSSVEVFIFIQDYRCDDVANGDATYNRSINATHYVECYGWNKGIHRTCGAGSYFDEKMFCCVSPSDDSSDNSTTTTTPAPDANSTTTTMATSTADNTTMIIVCANTTTTQSTPSASNSTAASANGTVSNSTAPAPAFFHRFRIVRSEPETTTAAGNSTADNSTIAANATTDNSTGKSFVFGKFARSTVWSTADGANSSSNSTANRTVVWPVPMGKVFAFDATKFARSVVVSRDSLCGGVDCVIINNGTNQTATNGTNATLLQSDFGRAGDDVRPFVVAASPEAASTFRKFMRSVLDVSNATNESSNATSWNTTNDTTTTTQASSTSPVIIKF